MMLYLKRKFAWVQRKLKTGVYLDGCTFVTSVARSRNSSNSLLKRCFRPFFKEPANSVKLHRKRRRPAISVVQCADFARLGRPYARVRDRSDSQRRSGERLSLGRLWLVRQRARFLESDHLPIRFIGYIFSSIFGGGSGPPSHFEAVYARITQIVQQQLQQVTTDHVNAAIKNVLQALLVEYDPRKKSSDLTKPADRQFLRREGKKASKPQGGEITTATWRVCRL
jgi:hypothetical protein